MTPTDIEKMSEAISLMKALLPDHLSLTAAIIGDFLSPPKNIRPFGHVRYV